MIIRTAAALLSVLAASPAMAHTGMGAYHGFAAGALHPLLGLDHLLAMGAVGLWAGLVGGRARVVWPASFVAVMVLGSLVGINGHSLPGAEVALAFSVLFLGTAVLVRASAAVAVGAAICAAFATVHGYVHGAELPAGSDPAGYVAGLAVSTTLLHGVGLGLATAFVKAESPALARFTGGAVAAAGFVFLLS